MKSPHRKKIERRLAHWHYKRRIGMWKSSTRTCLEGTEFYTKDLNLYTTYAFLRRIMFGDHASWGHRVYRHGRRYGLLSAKNERTWCMLADSLTKQ